mmetsp:Transcript_7152/g.15515  ORF Transcript_7152/g.15515 Transcript_7152/m.15515 type:complete len:318 (-) Transcript_7152:1559-2512(-)
MPGEPPAVGLRQPMPGVKGHPEKPLLRCHDLVEVILTILVTDEGELHKLLRAGDASPYVADLGEFAALMQRKPGVESGVPPQVEFDRSALHRHAEPGCIELHDFRLGGGHRKVPSMLPGRPEDGFCKPLVLGDRRIAVDAVRVGHSQGIGQPALGHKVHANRLHASVEDMFAITHRLLAYGLVTDDLVRPRVLHLEAAEEWVDDEDGRENLFKELPPEVHWQQPQCRYCLKMKLLLPQGSTLFQAYEDPRTQQGSDAGLPDEAPHKHLLAMFLDVDLPQLICAVGDGAEQGGKHQHPEENGANGVEPLYCVRRNDLH